MGRKKKKANMTIEDYWEKYLDRLWGMVIHSRDTGCQLCRKQHGKMDAHHVFTREARSTRWDTRNGILLCYYCHKYRILKDPEGLRIVIVNRLGIKEYEAMYLRFHQTLKYIDYKSWYLLLRDELEKLKVKIPRVPKILRWEEE